MLNFYNPEAASDETDTKIKSFANYIHLDTEQLDRYFKEGNDDYYNFGPQILGDIVRTAIDETMHPIFYEYPSDFYSALRGEVQDEEREFFSEDEYSEEVDLQNQVTNYRELFYKDALYGIAITGRPFNPESNGVHENVSVFEKYLLKGPYKTVFHYSEAFATLECITSSFDIPTIGGTPMKVHERSWFARPATEEEANECSYYLPLDKSEFIKVNNLKYVPFSAKNWCRLLGSKFPDVQIPEEQDERYILFITETDSGRHDSATQMGTIHVVDKNTGFTVTQYHFIGQNAERGWSVFGVTDRQPFELSAKTVKTYDIVTSRLKKPNASIRQVTSSTYRIKNGAIEDDPFEIDEETVEFGDRKDVDKPIERTGGVGHRLIKPEDSDI